MWNQVGRPNTQIKEQEQKPDQSTDPYKGWNNLTPEEKEQRRRLAEDIQTISRGMRREAKRAAERRERMTPEKDFYARWSKD